MFQTSGKRRWRARRRRRLRRLNWYLLEHSERYRMLKWRRRLDQPPINSR